MGWRHWRWLLVIVLAGISIAIGLRWWQARQFRHAIAEIESIMAAGRYPLAAHRLNEMLIADPGCDEAAYQLGVCERARGRTKEADHAWARVTPASSFFSRAVSERMALMVDIGRFARAEEIVDEAAEARPKDRAALRILLLPLFNQEGRLEDVERLIEDRWQGLHETGEQASELAVNLGRLSLDMQWNRPPTDLLRADLDRAAKLAPDDDRVWLGQANLAIRTKSFETAERLLDACLKIRPDDVSVCTARLNWAMAADRIEALEKAMTQLPARFVSRAQTERVQAFLAARYGDQDAERRALDRLVAADPFDRAAVTRLLELTRRDGQPERVTEIERRSAEIAPLNERFHKLYDRNQPIRDSDEMGQLALRLGHTFVAKVLLTVAAAKSLHPDDARRLLAEVTARSSDR